MLNCRVNCLFREIAANVCVSSVVRFRSRVLSPTQNIERRYRLWITPHRTIEETFCYAQGFILVSPLYQSKYPIVLFEGYSIT